MLANNVIQDALAIVDVVAPGEVAEAYWSQLAVRLLNGMLGEWTQKGYFNPLQSYAETDITATKDYYTLGTDDSIRTLSETRYAVYETASVTGTYYKSIRTVAGQSITRYLLTGTGTTYELVIVEDTEGTFYAVNGGLSQKFTGDIADNYYHIQSVQLDLGSVSYSPRQISLAEYQSLSVKQVGSVPQYYALDYQQPVSKLYFWPRPLQNMKLRIVGQPTIESITNSQSNIVLDDIYYNAILYNLATRIYPFLKRDAGIDKEIVYLSRSTLTALRSRTLVSKSKRQSVPFGSSANCNDYWSSNLNTVNGSGV